MRGAPRRGERGEDRGKPLNQVPRPVLRFADGSIALHSAAVSGDHELIGLLLQRRADRSITNRRGHRPYDVAKDERTRSLLA